ncbi:unnamed protein product [Effrenium voratum]|nr:unnamed protein product [Effrenium voratum]
MSRPGGMDISKWNIIYPNYINSKKTVQEGRRVGLEKACEHPRAFEMAEVCEYLKIPHVCEPDKAYPRDWLIRGRVRILLGAWREAQWVGTNFPSISAPCGVVRLKTPEGAFTHPEAWRRSQSQIHTKKDVMCKMGELIPKPSSREVWW